MSSIWMVVILVMKKSLLVVVFESRRNTMNIVGDGETSCTSRWREEKGSNHGHDDEWRRSFSSTTTTTAFVFSAFYSELSSLL